jgi:glycosidase
MAHWSFDSIFYHIYPLGLCGAPQRNDFSSPATPRLEKLYAWIPHMKGLGINALYLGPLFESTAHGYDTADYYWVDRRLGTNDTLKQLSAVLHANGIRLVLDGVFNHVGRNFWAFRDVLARGEQSPYRDWFANLTFGKHSPYGDPFTYEGWAGHYDLVKLNLHNPAVKEHLLQAVAAWVRDFDLDGLRLDAADVVEPGFLGELAAFTRILCPDFWLMGEIVHGDYRCWANPHMLDSVTNYECYKGLYSSLAERNYFEIAYALNRQFGEGGLYPNLPLYAFADNHDVNRVASNLIKPAHLYPLYCLLFSMPGVPSIYYGSEWGLTGQKHNGSDLPLRPALDLPEAAHNSPHPQLAHAIARLADVRQMAPALRYGNYRQLHVNHEQLAFARQSAEQQVVVALNASDEPAAFDLALSSNGASRAMDLLNPGESFPLMDHRLKVIVPPNWARILQIA